MIEELIRSARSRQRRAVALGMVSAALAALAGVALLAISGWFITGAAIAGAGGVAAVRAFNYLIPSAAIRGLAIVRTLARYGERLFSHQAMLFALADVRAALFARLIDAPPASALRQARGDVAARLGGDVEALEESLLRSTVLPSAIATMAGSLLLVALAGWSAALVLLLAAAGVAMAGRLIGARRLGPAMDAESAALGTLRQRYVELAAGGDDILVYGIGDAIRSALADAESPLHDARIAIARADVSMALVHWFATGVAVAAVPLLSRADPPIVALGALTAAAAMEIVGLLVRLDQQRWRSIGARDRIDAMFPPRGETVRVEGDAALTGAVTLTIGGRRHDVGTGDRVVLTGASGAGKTRLLETLVGLRDDAPEHILIDGAAARDLPWMVRRDLFSLSAQDAPMIAGTVADNLALARPGISRVEMERALDVACLGDVVAALPNGLDCWMGEDGARLSGGQRKRLSLARALLANRAYLLLDEPSEGLDSATEARLVERLKAWLDETGRGLILVSHRPAMHRLVSRRIDLGGAG